MLCWWRNYLGLAWEQLCIFATRTNASFLQNSISYRTQGSTFGALRFLIHRPVSSSVFTFSYGSCLCFKNEVSSSCACARFGGHTLNLTQVRTSVHQLPDHWAVTNMSRTWRRIYNKHGSLHVTSISFFVFELAVFLCAPYNFVWLLLYNFYNSFLSQFCSMYFTLV